MKIRDGFVSNSSSSSFIVGFDKKPTSAMMVFQALFPGKGLDHTEGFWHEQRFSGMDIATAIWDKIDDQSGSIPIDVVRENVSVYYDTNTSFASKPPVLRQSEDSPWKYQHSDPAKFKKLQKQQDLAWKTHGTKVDAWIDRVVLAIQKNMKGMWIYSFEISDHGGELECYLEHGEYSRDIPYFRFSHH